MNREEDIREWVEYAEADRLSAQNAFNAADYRDVAFHCHQAIEKLLKAAIVAQTGQRPPYTHNLWKLAQAVQGLTIPPEIGDKMASINPHYIVSRYPTGIRTDYTKEIAVELLQTMQEVYQWLMEKLRLSNA